MRAILFAWPLKGLRKNSTGPRKGSPQALKRNAFSTTYGTTEVVPFRNNVRESELFRSL